MVLDYSITPKYIYSFKYNFHHAELCGLESRQVFGQAPSDKLLLSNLKINPSASPFIKCRFEIAMHSKDYSVLLEHIKSHNIVADNFKVEYVVLGDDDTSYKERLNKLRDIGLRIEGEPDYDFPTIIYGICFYENIWYFGILVKHNADWQKHNEKPFKFSNSINIDIAKTLVNVATGVNSEKRLLDACCGVGTIMLEACIAGVNIEGCDINWKAFNHTRENLKHYNYTANVFNVDVKDLKTNYDAAIIDLPYNHTTYSDDSITENIISSAAKISTKLVIVSITDMHEIITKLGLVITDYCTVEKLGKSAFTRSIWVCERESE